MVNIYNLVGISSNPVMCCLVSGGYFLFGGILFFMGGNSLKKSMRSQLLIRGAMDKKIYSIAFILLALFSLTQLATLLKSSLEINIYDIYTKITDFYSLFYFIIPLFTLFLLVFFIKVRNMEYAILRFLSRKELFCLL